MAKDLRGAVRRFRAELNIYFLSLFNLFLKNLRKEFFPKTLIIKES